MEGTATALGVVSTALAGLLGYTYYQSGKVGKMTDYKTEVCKNLYAQHRIFSEKDLNKESTANLQQQQQLLGPTSSVATQVRDHDLLEECRRVIFPRKWFGGKKTRKARKVITFMSRRR
jgi:hypothetical protein